MGFLDFWDNLIDGNEGNSSGNITYGRQKLVNDLTGSNTISNTLGSTNSTGSVVPQPGVTNNPYADIGNSSNAGSMNNTSSITNRKAATGSNNAKAGGGEKQTSYIYNNKQVIPEVPAWMPSKSNLINPWENMNKNGASQITWPDGEEKAAKERNRDELEKISSQHFAEERAYNEAKAEEEKNGLIDGVISKVFNMEPETEEEELKQAKYVNRIMNGLLGNNPSIFEMLEEEINYDLMKRDLNAGLDEYNQSMDEGEDLGNNRFVPNARARGKDDLIRANADARAKRESDSGNIEETEREVWPLEHIRGHNIYYPILREDEQKVENPVVGKADLSNVIITTDPAVLKDDNKIQWGEVGSGLLQTVGGFSELATGIGIATGGTALSGGLAGVLAISSGGYMVADGISNISEGVANILEGFNILDIDSENWNFMRNSYKALFPEYGDKIYSATEIGIGIYCIGKGIYKMPNKATSITTSDLGYYAVGNGAKTWSEIVQEGRIININTWTDSGLLVNSLKIDPMKITTGILLIGIDTVNTYEAKQSIELNIESKTDMSNKSL